MIPLWDDVEEAELYWLCAATDAFLAQLPSAWVQRAIQDRRTAPRDTPYRRNLNVNNPSNDTGTEQG